MRPWRRLSVRLFLSYLIVIVVGSAVFAGLTIVLATRAFDARVGGGRLGNGAGNGPPYHRAFRQALTTSLPITVVISVLAAAVLAAWLGRRILRPISAIRRAAAELSQGHYEQRIPEGKVPELAALAHDVNHLAASLQHIERRRAELIGEVAHELRTPLTTIDGYVEGILDGVFEPSEEILVAIGEETARLGRLVADLATLSRTEEGSQPLRLTELDLAGLAREVTERLRPQFADKAVELGLLTPGPVWVRGDADRLRQVLVNLIGNALTYTPAAGRVTVTVRAGASASVVVQDTGIGLAGPDRERIFDRFYRVAGVVRPPGGSGIGLTIARGLARAHRGEITVSSPGPGLGTTFVLSLPARPSDDPN